MRSGRCLAIDVNSGHVDARVLDVHGNPVGRPIRENIPEQGSSAHRLGARREAVSQLVKRAQRQGVTVIAIEKLDFADIRTMGRQRGRRGKDHPPQGCAAYPPPGSLTPSPRRPTATTWW